MHCDTFTAVGDKEVCQDYVASYRKNMVVVTDGCSSAINTDVGARLINHSIGTNDSFLDIEDICNKLGLPEESLYCTMLKLQVVTNEQKLYFLRYGDGFFAYGDGKTTTIEQFIYTQNAPYYVGYSIFGKDVEFKEIKQHLVKKLWVFDDKFKILSKELVVIKEPDKMLDESSNYSCRDWQWAAVSSDGLSSFMPETDTLLEEVILPKFFGFKNLYGNFLKRRCKVALRELKADGYEFYDDISIGAIVL